MNCIRCPFCKARIEVGVTPLLLTAEQAAARLNVNIRTLWRMVKAGNGFPGPVRYNRKLVRWKAEDVEAYVRGLS